jgi:hypothetical protein
VAGHAGHSAKIKLSYAVHNISARHLGEPSMLWEMHIQSDHVSWSKLMSGFLLQT